MVKEREEKKKNFNNGLTKPSKMKKEQQILHIAALNFQNKDKKKRH